MPLAVSPARGWNEAATRVVIEGQHFHPLLTAEARGDAVRTDAEFEVFLVAGAGPEGDLELQPLTRVELLDVEHLSAVVPEGLQVGVYDVLVRAPNGQQGRLPDAFTVTDSEAAGFQLLADEVRSSWTVNDVASFSLRLVNPSGDFVHEGMPVRMSLRAADDAPLQASFLPGILRGQQTDRHDSGDAIVGTLDEVGAADIQFTVASAGKVVLTVESLDDGPVGLPAAVRDTTWVTGVEYDIALEPSRSVVRAGETFSLALTVRDEFGNVVESPVEQLDGYLTDSCRDLGLLPLYDVRGRIEIPLDLTRATGSVDCPEQHLVVLLDGLEVQSGPIQVIAGPADRFDVALNSTSYVAGTPLRAIVQAVDAHRNVVPWTGEAGRLEVTDTIGDVRTTGCFDGDTFNYCVATPIDAERTVRLHVTDPVLDLVGTSAAYEVTAAPLDRIEVEIDGMGAGVIAGEPTRVTVSLTDEYGNDVPAVDVVEGDITLTDEATGSALCLFEGPAERGQVTFRCTLYQAAEDVRLEAVESSGITARSLPFRVINNEVARIDVTPAVTTIAAGSPFSLHVEAFDAWGNPYLYQSSSDLDLEDGSGTLSLGRVGLESDGTGDFEVFIARAGRTVVQASRGGAVLGSSAPIEVQAAPASGFAVTVDRPWAWMGDGAMVSLQARDRFDNDADYTGTVDVASAAGTFDTVITSVTGGVGTAALTFTGSERVESVEASNDTGLSGRSPSFMVLEDCGTRGPSAVLAFSGASDAVVCYDGTDATIDGSFSGSTSSDGTLDRYGLWLVGATHTVGGLSSVELTANDVGQYEIRGVVVHGECGSEVRRTAWVGLDDGQPVGPLRPKLGNSTLEAGSDVTSITFSNVLDCNGDPASKGVVQVRTDRGELSGVKTSGKGLELKLDTNGDGSATLDLTSALAAGSGTVYATVASGAASGSASFSVTGDQAPPHVVSQDPHGYTADLVESVLITFSDAIAPSSLTGRVSVTGPDVVGVSEVLVDGKEVEILLDTTISGADGQWTVRLESGITDVAGNRLDGAWSGAAGDYLGLFGKVSAVVPDMKSCTASVSVFRPDGDDGRSSEADSTTFSLTATRNVATWDIAVQGDAGAVRHAWVQGTSTTGSWVWDGRADDERVVVDGAYTVQVTARNQDGTPGASCETVVTVDNRRGL